MCSVLTAIGKTHLLGSRHGGFCGLFGGAVGVSRVAAVVSRLLVLLCYYKQLLVIVDRTMMTWWQGQKSNPGGFADFSLVAPKPRSVINTPRLENATTFCNRLSYHTTSCIQESEGNSDIADMRTVGSGTVARI